MDKLALIRWLALPAENVLVALADAAKQDVSYRPIKSLSGARWHAALGGRDFELLLTGTKFRDTRAKTGGGGAVDLAMHITGLDFRRAVKLLEKRGI